MNVNARILNSKELNNDIDFKNLLSFMQVFFCNKMFMLTIIITQKMILKIS